MDQRVGDRFVIWITGQGESLKLAFQGLYSSPTSRKEDSFKKEKASPYSTMFSILYRAHQIFSYILTTFFEGLRAFFFALKSLAQRGAVLVAAAVSGTIHFLYQMGSRVWSFVNSQKVSVAPLYSHQKGRGGSPSDSQPPSNTQSSEGFQTPPPAKSWYSGGSNWTERGESGQRLFSSSREKTDNEDSYSEDSTQESALSWMKNAALKELTEEKTKFSGWQKNFIPDHTIEAKEFLERISQNGLIAIDPLLPTFLLLGGLTRTFYYAFFAHNNINFNTTKKLEVVMKGEHLDNKDSWQSLSHLALCLFLKEQTNLNQKIFSLCLKYDCKENIDFLARSVSKPLSSKN